jgi:hypothetical protein
MILIFEQDSFTRDPYGVLNHQYLADFFTCVDDHYINTEYEDDTILVLQTVDKEEGDSCKFIYTK